MSEQEPSRTLPRTGRLLAWLGVLGMMVGLTAFYQLLMPTSGGLVQNVTEGGTVRIELQRDRSGHYRVPGEINGHAVERSNFGVSAAVDLDCFFYAGRGLYPVPCYCQCHLVTSRDVSS